MNVTISTASATTPPAPASATAGTPNIRFAPADSQMSLSR